MKLIIKIAIAAIAVGAAFLIYLFCFSSNKKILVGKGEINKIDTMAELCTIDFCNEVPIIDTVGNWECFGKQKQRGSISFDIEHLQIDTDGDTVKIILPAENIEIMESTDKEAWKSIDSKDLRFGRWEKASPEVWNEVKKNAMSKSKKALYTAGIVERARKEGAENLQLLMEKVYRKPVKVSDPTPKGAHYDEFK